MKKIILVTLASVFLLASFAHAADAAKYEVRNVRGQNVVMISQTLAESIDKITKDESKTMNQKLEMVRSLVYIEGTMIDGEKGSFCEVSGETYKTVNTNAEKMAKQCSDRMARGDDMVNELITDYKDVAELRLNYSLGFMLMITFSM